MTRLDFVVRSAHSRSAWPWWSWARRYRPPGRPPPTPSSGPPTVTPADIQFRHDTLRAWQRPPGRPAPRPGGSHARRPGRRTSQPTPDHPGYPAYAGAVVLAAKDGVIVQHAAVGSAVKYAAVGPPPTWSVWNSPPTSRSRPGPTPSSTWRRCRSCSPRSSPCSRSSGDGWSWTRRSPGTSRSSPPAARRRSPCGCCSPTPRGCPRSRPCGAGTRRRPSGSPPRSPRRSRTGVDARYPATSTPTWG